MLAKINAFFQSLNEGANSASSSELSLEIAGTVLLCEVMLADGRLDKNEQEKLNSIISQQFNLAHDEVVSIIEQAMRLYENATDFYQFTSKLNEHYNVEQRVKMLELLWQVAYADGHLDSIEEHIIRKIADLLHLRHSEFIQTKLNAAKLNND